MGLRRLRGRLDQLQGNANFTMAMAQDLLADLQDGFGVTVSIDKNAARTILTHLLKGLECDLPIRIKVDPTVDAKEK